jgi:hypothetical protein
LWEEPDQAKLLFGKLSLPARVTMQALLDRRIDVGRPRILELIQSEGKQIAAVSPVGNMQGLTAPVYGLHGSQDNVIPPAESLWLARDIPRQDLRGVLTTAAFSHVDPEKHPPLIEELRLIHFVSRALHAAD